MSDVRPPPGFTLINDAPAAPKPPPGFALVDPKTGAPAQEFPGLPPGMPPPGYKQPEQPGQWESFKRGLQAIADDPSLLLGIGPARIATDFAKSVASGATLPGDVYAGKVDPMSDEGIGRAAELAAIASPVNPAIRAGDKIVPGVTKNLMKPEPPSAEALHAAGDAGYKQAREMGVDYSSEAVANLAKGVKTELEAKGLIPKNAPTTHGILDELANPPPGSVATITGVDAARQAFGHAAGKFTDPAEQKAAISARKAIEEFLERPPEGAVVAGPAAEAGATITDARGNLAAGHRSDRLAGIERAADLRSSAANSGQNLDNSVRGRVASVLLDKGKSAGFNEAEIAALEAVNAGSRGANTARWVGNTLGGGAGLGALATSAAGAAAGSALGPTGAALGASLAPAVGFTAKKTANALTERALQSADELVRSRSPLHEGAPLVPSRQMNREAILRALMLQRQQEQTAP